MQRELKEKLKAAGLLKSKFDDYERIYYSFQNEVKKTGSKMQAYTNVSVELGFSEITVQRAVKAMASL